MFELNSPRPAPNATQNTNLSDRLPALANALAYSPYLTRLARARADTVSCLADQCGETCVEDVIKRVKALSGLTDETQILKDLRQAKADMHLSLARMDLSCEWSWNEVTRALSRFSDAAIEVALILGCRKALERGWISWDDQTKPVPGLFILSLGKLGGFELNYSSDVDLVAMYDSDIFPAANISPADAARRIIQAMSQHLETMTEHGYVLRVDLRLRPDPRSTPVAISTQSAEVYYESRGQNWERMAYIKARPTAGDSDAATHFLNELTPFVWRRHLDFWALEDIRAIKQQINSSRGQLDMEDPEFDVKLGPGGIREIEFFAQTQQLIHGGRNLALRSSRTLDALAALAEAGHIEPECAADLSHAYGLLRAIEHRIQMLNDEHTHTLSKNDETRDKVAALCGYDTLSDFDASVRELRKLVNGYFADLFRETEQLPGVTGNLVFTGVDDDPGTLETLSKLGFSNPSSVIADFQNWHRGGIRATRSQRGRHLLTAMERRLFQLMADTGKPDAAFDGLRTFFSGLSSGVQTLSLLAANPAILEDIISIFSVAPRLARDLGSRPELLESLLEGGFLAPLSEDTCGHYEAIHRVPETLSDDFEGAMNEVRRHFRDAHFRIRFKVLHDPQALRECAPAFTALADSCIEALTPVALKQAEKSLGDAPGKWVICGLGKLGSHDLTADSDLDLMVVFDSDDQMEAPRFFARATQRLVTALSAQTEEGQLYEADMQLRPSGRAGPVAVRLSAFADYYRNDAWTWEHMALTRLRPIAGDKDLARRLIEEKEAILSIARDPAAIAADAWDMRQRLLKDRPAKHEFDLKLSQGAMMDVEFIVQVLQLQNPDRDWGKRTVTCVLDYAVDYECLGAHEAETLKSGYALMSGVLAFQRIALPGPTLPQDWPDVLKARTCRAVGAESFAALADEINHYKTKIWEILCRKLQSETTE